MLIGKVYRSIKSELKTFRSAIALTVESFIGSRVVEKEFIVFKKLSLLLPSSEAPIAQTITSSAKSLSPVECFLRDSSAVLRNSLICWLSIDIPFLLVNVVPALLSKVSQACLCYHRENVPGAGYISASFKIDGDQYAYPISRSW